jgi:uncharacterized protein YjbI with pentapeptide repeats
MPEPDPSVLLDQIKAFTGIVTATWAGLMVGVGYSWVVIGSLSDIDILIDGSSLELPLLGSAINPTGYFFAASAVLCIVTVYLHISIVRLWSLYGRLPQQVDGLARGDRVAPWIGTALLPGSETAGPLAPLAAIAALISVWVAPVVTIVALGGRYVLVGQGIGVILWHAAAAVVTAVVAAVTLWLVNRRAPAGGERSDVPAVVYGVGLLAFVALVGMSATSVSRPTHVNFFLNSEVNLSRLNLLALTQGLPDGWEAYDNAKAEALGGACEELGSSECNEALSKFDDERGEWRRNHYPRTSLIEEKLTGARLVGANLLESVLEGLDLRGIDLSGADLSDAKLQHANLSRASLEGANLSGADLERAVVLDADFSGATLIMTNLSRAVDDFVGNPDRAFVDFDGAVLIQVNTDRQLRGTARDALLIGSHRWSRVGLDPTFALMTMAGYGWRSDWLPFQGSTMQFVEHAAGLEADGAALRFLDVSRLKYLWFRDGTPISPRIDFESVFGDRTVLLPAKVPTPCHWAPFAASDEQFFGRWRGWRESRGQTWPPSAAIGEIWISPVRLFASPAFSEIVDPFEPGHGGIQGIPGARFQAKSVKPIPPEC